MASFNNLTPAALLSDIRFGIDGLQLLTNVFNADTVAIFDQESLKQVFKNARPVKATVRETSRVMDYPVENGATLSDHHILNPTTIEMMFIINSEFYSEAYQQMRSAWINATKLSVQTRTGVYSNMIIAEVPHEEEPDMFNAITVALRLREVIFVIPSSSTQPTNYAPLDAVNANTIPRGFQLAKTLLNSVSSASSYIRLASLFGVKL
jgi:hypothetical protein